MAIDTVNKRFSMMNLGIFYHLPVPDGIVDSFDRFQYIKGYAGIALGLISIIDLWNAKLVRLKDIKELISLKDIKELILIG